jgi:hypothetical protein
MSQFRADCSRCCGLCCIVPDQLTVQGFPSDKPANTACRYMDAYSRCSIHEKRREHGYQACEEFDCFGAGQWITQELFANARWTDSSGVAHLMFSAYRHWQPRFESAALLEAALPHVRDDARSLVTARIDALTDAKAGDLQSLTDGNRLRRETLLLIHLLLVAP